MKSVAAARSHWEANGATLLGEFADLLAIPDVATDPMGLRRNADWIASRLAGRGVQASVRQLDDAAPVVIGRVEGPADGPVFGVYAHYDGQPVDEDRWSSSPFGPTLLSRRLEDGGEEIAFPVAGELVDPEWRVYARGSADDRAPIAALLGALDAVEDRGASLILLFEGEEEQGSPHLPAYLHEFADELAADAWLICDGPVHQSGRPQVALGVRGFAEVEMEVFGPPHDLHSGHYGETALNPIVALAELITSMRDSDGNLVVPGLRGPEPPSALRAAAAEVPEPELGFAVNPDGSYAGRLLRPLLNVRGVRSADVGPDSRNVIPGSAVASIDLRLVAGQDPAEAIATVRAHVAGQGYHLVAREPSGEERRVHRRMARVDGIPGYPGILTDPSHPTIERVIAAVAAAAGDDPIVLPSFGGSVPLHHFVERLAAPLVIVPIANHDNNQHSEDENLRLGNLAYGVRVMAALLGGD